MATISKIAVHHFRAAVSAIDKEFQNLMEGRGFQGGVFAKSLDVFLSTANDFSTFTTDSLAHLGKEDNAVRNALVVLERAGIHIQILQELEGLDRELIGILTDISTALRGILDAELERHSLAKILDAIQQSPGSLSAEQAFPLAGRYAPIYADKFRTLHARIATLQEKSQLLGTQFRNADRVVEEAMQQLKREKEHESHFFANIMSWAD